VELGDFYSSLNIVSIVKNQEDCVGLFMHVIQMEETGNIYRILVEVYTWKTKRKIGLKW
jgi:ribosomal protein S4E